MSEAAVDQQTPQARFSHALREWQESAHGRHEPEPRATQKTAGVDDDWGRIIDNKLIEWGRDPSRLDEEGTVAPTKQTIQFAIALASWLRNQGFPAPTRVVPDAHGGIVFEVQEQNLEETLRLSADLGLEYCAFDNGRLVHRQELPSPVGAWQQSGVSRANGPGPGAARSDWDKIINDTLVEWERDPSQAEDIGIDAPSAETVGKAILQARLMRDQGLPAPTRIVPDPNGGIVFRRDEEGVSEEYHFWEDGVVEYMRYHGSKLVERRGKRLSSKSSPDPWPATQAMRNCRT